MPLTLRAFKGGYNFFWNIQLVMVPAFPSTKFSNKGMTESKQAGFASVSSL